MSLDQKLMKKLSMGGSSNFEGFRGLGRLDLKKIPY